jgi:hypothetical protein
VEGATSQPTSQPGASNHFGAPFNSDAHPIELATALETCAGTGSACKVTGTIDRVCQTRGCWFTLTEDGVDETIRVRMQDYAFFVPRDAVGKRVVFEGVMTREEVSIETAQHYADHGSGADLRHPDHRRRNPQRIGQQPKPQSPPVAERQGAIVVLGRKPVSGHVRDDSFRLKLKGVPSSVVDREHPARIFNDVRSAAVNPRKLVDGQRCCACAGRKLLG